MYKERSIKYLKFLVKVELHEQKITLVKIHFTEEKLLK